MCSFGWGTDAGGTEWHSMNVLAEKSLSSVQSLEAGVVPHSIGDVHEHERVRSFEAMTKDHVLSLRESTLTAKLRIEYDTRKLRVLTAC